MIRTYLFAAAIGVIHGVGIVTAMNTPSPGDGGGDGGNNNYSNLTSNYTIDTNGLWLEITNVSNGLAYLNLNNATDSVYDIFSKTDLTLTNWNIEQEVWPTNPAVMPFVVAELGRTNLFIWAQDWTEVTENGNTTPDWWFWEYFGTVALSDTNLDSKGNTLLDDYLNGHDPNVIQFSLQFTNYYVNTGIAYGTITILGGVPSYEAVLVNDTNFADANWQPYSPTVVVPLNSGDGNYNVWVGLRGLPSDAQQTWQWTRLTLDTVAPTLTVTNPASSVVSVPMIQLEGYVSEMVSKLTYDVSNATGILTNQQGYWNAVFYDTNLLEFTTNSFQCYDVVLANGLNTITLHATDLTGNTATTNVSLTLNYSGDTTPPALNIIWPQDGTYISGSQFTLQGQVDDATAKITAFIVDASGDTNSAQGLVERSGLVWIQNLQLAAGANILTVIATDAAGNISTTTLTLHQSSVMVTINPLNQFNQSSVTVTGTISDPSNAVWVNGVEAYYIDDAGDWEADGVPVSPTGTATFDVEVYLSQSDMVKSQLVHAYDLPSGTDIGSEWFTLPQPVTVVLSSYSKVAIANDSYYSEGAEIHDEYNVAINWVMILGATITIGGLSKGMNRLLEFSLSTTAEAFRQTTGLGCGVNMHFSAQIMVILMAISTIPHNRK